MNNNRSAFGAALLPPPPLRRCCSAGCSRADDRTVGQKVDSAVATADRQERAGQGRTQAERRRRKQATTRPPADLKDRAANAANTVADKVQDATITASVNAELAKEPALSALKINVDTVDGHVSLRGSAPTAEARERATRLGCEREGRDRGREQARRAQLSQQPVPPTMTPFHCCTLPADGVLRKHAMRRVRFDARLCAVGARTWMAFDPTPPDSSRATPAARLMAAHGIGRGRLRPCANRMQHDVCNWMIDAGDDADPVPQLPADQVIPSLDNPTNLQHWAAIERAKRRLVFTLIEHRPDAGSRRPAPTTSRAWPSICSRRCPASRR